MSLKFFFYSYGLGWSIAFFSCCLSQVNAQEVFIFSESSVIDRVFEQSRHAQITRIQSLLAKNEAWRARSIYDSRFLLDVNHNINSSDTAITVFGTRNDTTNLNARYQVLYPSGTALEVGLFQNRATSNSQFMNMNPAYESIWSIGLKQSLLNNFFGVGQRSLVESAEQRALAAEHYSMHSMEAIAFSAAQLFWQWMAAKEEEQISKQASERAMEFLVITKKKLNLGIAEAADLYAAQANFESKEEEKLAAAQNSETVCRKLFHVLRISFEHSCVSQESLEHIPLSLDSLSVYLDRALNDRMDLIAAQDKLKSLELQLRSATSLGLPQLNLTTKLSLNSVDDSWNKAFGDSVSLDHPQWFVGGEFVFLFGNKEAMAQQKKSQLELEQAQLEYDQLKEDIQSEVTIFYDQLLSFDSRAKKAEVVRKFEEQKLKAKERDFQSGRTDALTIILYQNDLLRANRVLSLLLVQKSMAALTLRYSTGALRPKPSVEFSK